MGTYQVYYLNRDGRTERSSLRARNKGEALKAARERYDDVLKVKRVPSRLGRVLLVSALIAAAVWLLAVL